MGWVDGAGCPAGRGRVCSRDRETHSLLLGMACPCSPRTPTHANSSAGKAQAQAHGQPALLHKQTARCRHEAAGSQQQLRPASPFGVEGSVGDGVLAKHKTHVEDEAAGSLMLQPAAAAACQPRLEMQTPSTTTNPPGQDSPRSSPRTTHSLRQEGISLLTHRQRQSSQRARASIKACSHAQAPASYASPSELKNKKSLTERSGSGSSGCLQKTHTCR